MATFIAIGENIHCSRILKIDGESVVSREDGSLEIQFSEGGTPRALPLPQNAPQIEEWTKGRKVKHLAVAIWQGMHGGAAAQETAVAYLRYIAAAQTAKGAAYLDVNVDEFSTEREEKIRAMRWVAATVQQASPLPLSIDSSDVELLNAGLEACDPSRGKPLLNSVSLERMAALDIARSVGASVIAGATGETTMPSSAEERLQNFDALLPHVRRAGLDDADIYLDPLVFPAATDSSNGKKVIETIARLRQNYGAEIHIAPGLSNVSFGLPKRPLLNMVFAYLCVEHGCDGGIVDPRHINAAALAALDTGSEAFKLAKAFLLGEDEYGVKFIRAARKGVI